MDYIDYINEHPITWNAARNTWQLDDFTCGEVIEGSRAELEILRAYAYHADSHPGWFRYHSGIIVGWTDVYPYYRYDLNLLNSFGWDSINYAVKPR